MTALNLSTVKFTHKSDVVNPGKEIYNRRFSYVDTSKGDDQIIGTSKIIGDFALGTYVGVASKNSKAIPSAKLRDRASVDSYGIKNQGIINTNDGSDIVRGKATANISAIAETVSAAIAIAQRTNATAIAKAFADLNVKATANGIDNSRGEIYTGKGSDSVSGDTKGSIAAVAIATLDASAIVEAICKAPISERLTAFAKAMATSLAKGTISATGINNIRGIITTGKDEDTVSASATSSADSFAGIYGSTFANASPGNQALAEAVANASAVATDKAIAIDNYIGSIDTGTGNDTIEATAKATKKAIAISNYKGSTETGTGNDTIEATAKATDRAIAIDNYRGSIETGAGKDTIETHAVATDKAIAISNYRGSIETGTGNDTIEAIAKATDRAIAIDNYRGSIETGVGDDTIIAKASDGSEAYGIFGGNINTGRGSDRIIASSFGGGVNIDLAEGNDFIQGFGDARVDGGKGFDILSFGSYNQDDFQITVGANNNHRVSFELDGMTMTTTGFEQFNFANGVSSTFEQLKLA